MRRGGLSLFVFQFLDNLFSLLPRRRLRIDQFKMSSFRYHDVLCVVIRCLGFYGISISELLRYDRITCTGNDYLFHTDG